MSTVPVVRIPPVPALLPGTARPELCLNDRSGAAWELLPTPAEGLPAVDAACQDLPDGALPDAGWVPLAVPGELVMQGFDIENNVEYLCRRRVEVPADFAADGAGARRVLVRFDGVYSNARVWADGRLVGAHVGGFTTWDCDVTDVARPGSSFELVVGVADVEGDNPGAHNPDGSHRGDPSWASCYAHHNIGGILRDVTLVALPATHVASLHVSTTFDDAWVDATLGVELELAGAHADASCAVLLGLFDPAGEKVLEERAACDGRGRATLRADVAAPAKWDAEHPNLYRLEVTLEREGEVVEVVRERVGFREISFGGAHGSEPNRVYVNGREVKLRGTCRHDVSDAYGRSTTRAEDWAEVEAYRAANVNHVRTSHYPPSRHLLEACDELGMYVEEETAACFQGTGGKHIHARPEDFLGTFAEMIERDRNRPCVIIWSLGNESAFERTPAFAAELAHARAVEASRPLIFSYPYTVERMPLPYDIVSRHYEGTGGVLGAAHMPVLHDEFAHVPCYDVDELKRDPNVRSFWGHGLRAAWDGVFATDGALGVDLWSGVDDVFPLPEGTGGRWQRHSRGTWPGYGEWGAVLDCHRREKPEAFLVRKAFSPVRMDEKDFVVSGGRLLAPIVNRLDHTWLSELRLVARADGRELPAEAVRVPDLAPHASGVLEVALPGDAGEVREVSLAWTLAGREVDSFVMRLRPDVAGLPAAGAGAPTPELELTPAEIRVSCANGALFRFSRRTGTLEAAEWGGRAVVVGGPRLHLTGAELFRPWSPTLTPWAAVEGNHVTVALQGGYGTRVPLQFFCRIYGDGRMDVEWQTRDTNLSASALSEVGLSFELADDVCAVSWERDAPYARYPEGHIARPRGRARRVCPEALEAGYGERHPAWPWADDMFDAYLSEPGDGAWRVATSDFKALREHIRRYDVHFSAGDACVSALSDGRDAARVELLGAHPRLVVDNQWWYPQLGWGNDCGRAVQFVEGTTRGEVCLQVGPAARD